MLHILVRHGQYNVFIFNYEVGKGMSFQDFKNNVEKIIIITTFFTFKIAILREIELGHHLSLLALSSQLSIVDVQYIISYISFSCTMW